MSRRDVTLQPWVTATGALTREAATRPVPARAAGSGGRAGAAVAVLDPVQHAAPAQAPTHAVHPHVLCTGILAVPRPLQAGH